MKIITSILKKAGILLKKRYCQGAGFTEKEKYHLLSDADKEMHHFLKKHLTVKYPDHTVFSEEEPIDNTGNKQIIIDPIDGTTNFIAGKPYFTISIAIEENREIIEGHVYNPVSGEYYYADTKTGRSYYNWKRIETPAPVFIEESIVVLGLSYNPIKMDRYIKEWETLLNKCRKCLFWTTPAQTICNIARGRIGIFIDSGCSTYGQSAASLILKNTGGKMFNYDLSPYDHRIKGGIFISGGIDIDKVIGTRISGEKK